ncbi:MAG: hypothetical protein KBC74_01215 [Candidatus Pacebacteria bacterium]|nr:hypothetical protein [Candidatus Paceibacterota bacterium]
MLDGYERCPLPDLTKPFKRDTVSIIPNRDFHTFFKEYKIIMSTHLAEEAPREIANQKGNRRKSESALQRERARAAKDSAYAPVKITRAIYHDVFVKAKNDTDPAVVIARQKYRAAFQAYKQFIFQTEGLDAAERAVGAESWKARPYLSIAGKHITPEQMSATVAVGSIAVPAVAAAPLAAAFHLGGTSLYAMVAAGAGFGVASHFAIKPVAKGIREEYASKELAARKAGQTIEDFKKENRELLRSRAKSIGRRRLARLAASLGFTTATVITTGVLTPDHVGHSAGQWASKGVDAGLHHIGLEQGWADYLAHGTGAFQDFMQKVGAAAGVALQGLLGGPAAAAEMHAPGSQGVVRAGYVPTGTGSAVIETATGGAPEVGRTQLITHFGSAPWARSLTEALSPRSISEAADVLIRGGMNPEAREEFIAAANAFKNNQSPEFVDFTRREWEAQAFRTRGVPSVLGDGVDRVLFDASREPGFRGEHPPVYRALKMPFSYTDARGVLHEVMVEIPIGKADGSGEQDCYNFSLYSDSTVVTAPPPEAFVPPPTPERPVLVVPRVIWSEQSGFVASDCTSCGPEMKVTNLRILEYRGESLEEARQYMIRALSERSAWVDYQRNMDYKFVYLRFHNNLTGADTFHCLNLENNQFSQPTIVTDRGTEVVRTAEQFDGLVTGTSEEWRMTGGARTARGSDISVLSPKDPMPLFAVDPDGDGRPNRFVPGMDINGNGILEANEIGRNLNDVVNNQMYLIGNDIIPQEGGSPNAQAVLERTFLSRIPEAFIQGRTEGARFAALKAEFGGILSDEQIRELGRWLHFYEELHTTPAHPDGAAAYRNSDGSPKVIFQFLREGITETARPQDGSVGDFPDLRRAQ